MFHRNLIKWTAVAVMGLAVPALGVTHKSTHPTQPPLIHTTRTPVVQKTTSATLRRTAPQPHKVTARTSPSRAKTTFARHSRSHKAVAVRPVAKKTVQSKTTSAKSHLIAHPRKAVATKSASPKKATHLAAKSSPVHQWINNDTSALASAKE
ncbi:MAG TPA: hypothetical protein VHP11_13140 [Tepidisphaeraceae bacterium]|nr:hypothetical protein [Tepidisphaeraceae bacterium]